MVKGVNKKIIEINNPDSLYFEKAVLYIRPNVSVLPETVSRMESERLLRQMIPDMAKKRKNYKMKLAISFLTITALAVTILLLR